MDPRWLTVVRMAMPGDSAAHRQLMVLGAEYVAEGNQLVAGMAFEHAADAAWGDPPRMSEAFSSALACYLRVVDDVAPCSLESLAALVKTTILSWRSYMAPEKSAELDQMYLSEELAQRIFSCFSDSAVAESYLVRGAELRIASDGSVGVNFPPYEVNMGAQHGSPPDGWVVNLPSAFRLFVQQADYTAARAVADNFPTAFASPVLRGWRAAVNGFTDPGGAAKHFRDASVAFSQDVLTDGLPAADGAPFWSGINSQLWAPYFAARAQVADIPTAPERVQELIASAVTAFPVADIGWAHPGATAFGVLIATLDALLTLGASSDLRAMQEKFGHQMALPVSTPDSELVNQFVGLAMESFEGYRADPAREITSGRLHSALDLLERIPLLESGVASAVGPALGEQALNEMLGGQRIWVYRRLESITDELKLQKIVLRLIQSSLPIYAQVLHGPLEYGKDVVVAFKRDGRVVLRMYQLKAGDITTPVWEKARRELEDMFLVLLSDFQLHEAPDELEGLLLCNGHSKPNVQPVMNGWFAEQERDHDRQVRFEHLDDLVGWIMRDRLIPSLRSALVECGVPIVT